MYPIILFVQSKIAIQAKVLKNKKIIHFNLANSNASFQLLNLQVPKNINDLSKSHSKFFVQPLHI